MLEWCAILTLDILAVNRGVPAELAGNGRIGMLGVEPRTPILDNPLTLSTRGRVPCGDDAAALPWCRGTEPAIQRIEIVTLKSGQFRRKTILINYSSRPCDIMINRFNR